MSVAGSPGGVVLVPDALEANRAGTITDAQRAELQTSKGKQRRLGISVGLFFLAGGVLLFLDLTGLFTGRNGGTLSRLTPAEELAAGVGAILIALGCFWNALRHSRRETGVLRAPHVSMVEGFMHKSKRTERGVGSRHYHGPDYYTVYIVKILDRSGPISQAWWEAIPDGAYGRMYYLDGDGIVNVETTEPPPGVIDTTDIGTRPVTGIMHLLIGSDQRRQDAAAASDSIPGQSVPAQSRDAVLAGAAGSWGHGKQVMQLLPDGTGSLPLGFSGKSARLTWDVDNSGVVQIAEHPTEGQTLVIPARLSADSSTLTLYQGTFTAAMPRVQAAPPLTT
jgi:hypothetical protein